MSKLAIVVLFFMGYGVDALASDAICHQKTDVSNLSADEFLGIYGHCKFTDLGWVEEGFDAKNYRDMEIALGVSLLGMGYGHKELETRSKEAISAFQKESGRNPTGSLTLRDGNEMSKMGFSTPIAQLYLPSGGEAETPHMYKSADGEYVGFQGTWQIEGEGHAYPYNFTKYTCLRNTCQGIEVFLKVDGTSVNLFPPNKSEYKISNRTDSDFMMTDVGQPADACRKANIFVNLIDETVTEITRQIKPCIVFGEELPRLKTPRIANLVGSWDAAHKENEKARKSSQQKYSKEYRELLERIQD